MTITQRPFQPTDASALLALTRQRATTSLLDNPRFSDLQRWYAPVGAIASASREDEAYRQMMTQQATIVWEANDGALVAYALIPWPTTTLVFAIDPQAASQDDFMRAILIWGHEHIRRESRFPFVQCRCHEDDAALRDALDLAGFQPQPWQDVYLTAPLTDALPDGDMPAGFHLRSGVTPAEYAAYQQLHRDVFEGMGMSMDEHSSASYQPGLDLIAVAADGAWAGFCFCTLDRVADQQRDLLIGDVGVMGVHPVYRQRGIGRALLLMAMQRTQQQGAHLLALETENTPSPAMQLYRSLGFQPGSPWRWWRKPR